METIAPIKGTGDNELPSSVHEVLSNEDLLIEIFLRLPLISLHLFRSVSKLWLSLITSPNFIMRRSQITSGLLLRDSRSSDEYDFLPLDIRIPGNSYRLHAPWEGSTLTILDSCNGLLLCCTNRPRDVYVYNPSINNMFKMLPENDDFHLCLEDSYGGPKIAFDPTKSPYYIVVNAQLYSQVEIEIQTYSSKIGNWSVFDDDLFRPEEFESFYEGRYWNDAIHWVNWSRKGQILHHKLDVEYQGEKNKHTHVITMDDTMNCKDFQLFQSRGCLLFATMFATPSLELNVYEMTNDDSKWSVKFFVTLDEGWRSTPTNNIWDYFGVLSIILGEREEDSFVVMFLDGKVVRYNFVSNNVSTLTNYRSSSPPASFEFIESFARV